MPDITIATNTK